MGKQCTVPGATSSSSTWSTRTWRMVTGRQRRAQVAAPLFQVRRRAQAAAPLFQGPLFRKQGKSRQLRIRLRGRHRRPHLRHRHRAQPRRSTSSRLHRAPPRTSTPSTPASHIGSVRWTTSSAIPVRQGRQPGCWTTSSCIWAAQRSHQTSPQQNRRHASGWQCWRRWRRWRRTARGS